MFTSTRKYREVLTALGRASDEFPPEPELSGQQEERKDGSPYAYRPMSPLRLVHKMGFRYNPLHDLEALWWIAVYFPIAHTIVEDSTGALPPPDTDSDQLTRQRTSAERLFWRGDYRYDVMQRNGPFVEELQSLHPAVSRLWHPLEAIRQNITLSYRYVEHDMAAREFEPPVDVYNNMQQELFNIADFLETHDVKIEPLLAS